MASGKEPGSDSKLPDLLVRLAYYSSYTYIILIKYLIEGVVLKTSATPRFSPCIRTTMQDRISITTWKFLFLVLRKYLHA